MVGDGDLVLDRNAGSSTLGTTRPDEHSWNATGGGSSVTSNIALSEWGRYLGDATLTAAILDRLAMHAIRINIAGPNFRQHVAKSRAECAPAT